MPNTALKIENVSKLYRLGVISTGTLSHDLNRWWHRVRGKEDPYEKVAEANVQSDRGESDYVWALKDVSFDVQHGEAIGIIGKNGAGKSTLLKILSRVTSLTKGEIKINGRIASLLEVGTGFHPELTGRENIFLNGAILGMQKHEIRRKLDEIIAFAGVEKYVDTPVKRYSSGMKVRLAFAVAAHLEPDILVVDEVLAVGDADFQKKAIGKMQDVSQNEGRTVLFVSHNMAAVKSLCDRGVILINGKASNVYSAEEAVDRYLQQADSREIKTKYVFDKNINRDDFNVLIESAEITNKNNGTIFMSGDDIIIKINYKSKAEGYEGDMNIGLYDSYGEKINHLGASYVTGKNINFKKNGTITCIIPKLPLTAGRYNINFQLNYKGRKSHRVENALSFIVEQGDYFNSGKILPRNFGKFFIDSQWIF